MDFFIFLFFFVVSFFTLLAIFICVKIVIYTYAYFFWGAIYVKTTDEKTNKILELLEIKFGQKTADLGAGDGRLVIAMAKKGAIAYGYEINPFLVYIGKRRIRDSKLNKTAFMHCKNLWHEDVGDFDAIVVYGMKHMMGLLERKLDKELKPGAKVVLNYFIFPNWQPVKSEGDVHLYVKPSLDKPV
jgi:cyclopropane fatty-acyl-phospholipid synthase-like methyltransferase